MMELSKLLPGLIYLTVKFLNIIKIRTVKFLHLEKSHNEFEYGIEGEN